MRHLLGALMVVSAGLLAPTEGSAAPPAPLTAGPVFSISIRFSSEDRFPLGSLRMAIVAPDGKTGWQFRASGRAQVDSVLAEQEIEPHGWFAGPGRYTFVVSYRAGKNPGAPVKAAQHFLAQGSELRLTTSLWFVEDEKTKKAFLADLTVSRVAAGSGAVNLRQDWMPTAAGQPRYLVVNRLNRPIYGVGLWGHFFGHIQTDVKGSWQDYARGGFCGTVGGGPPIAPDESRASIEGYFIGEPRRFAPGRYRYVVLYALSPVMQGVPSEYVDGGVTRKRVLEMFELSSEFAIADDGKPS